MTFHEELARWQAALWSKPDDWQLRLVVADWLDENASPGWGDIYRAESARIREELRLEALGASKRQVCLEYSQRICANPEKWYEGWEMEPFSALMAYHLDQQKAVFLMAATLASSAPLEV